MKRACILAVILCASVGLVARADDSGDVVTPLAPAFGQDTDTVPQAVTDAMDKQRREAASAEDNKKTSDPVLDKGWLMRAYEKQEQTHDGAGNNFSNRVSSDRALAEAFGVPYVNPTATKSPGAAPGTRAPVSTNSQGLAPYAPAPASQTSLYSPSSLLGSGDGFKGMSDLYSSLPAAKLPVSTVPGSNPVKDTSALDTPGLTAAQEDPTSDLKLDFATPDSEQKMADQKNLFGPPLPPATNADLLQKSTDASMTLPTATKPSNVVSANAQPVKIFNDPTPDRVPQPSPVRQPIADPLDIPYH